MYISLSDHPAATGRINMSWKPFTLALAAVMLTAGISMQPTSAQDQSTQAQAGDSATSDQDTTASEANETLDKVTRQARDLAADTKNKVDEIADTLDQSQTVQDASAGVLKPIYMLAESLSFPAFYWVTFALMTAGCISFAFQLVLGKVVVLANGSMNIREILSDSVGLIICLAGLVLTTQAATENSTFAQSPSSVLSSAAAGVVLGLFLYRWGQAEEVDAARGRKAAAKKGKK